MIKTFAVAAIAGFVDAAHVQQTTWNFVNASAPINTQQNKIDSGYQALKDSLKVITPKVDKLSISWKSDNKRRSQLQGVMNIMGARASGQISTNLELKEEITCAKSDIEFLYGKVKEWPEGGDTAKNYSDYKASVDDLYKRQNFYLNGLVRLEKLAAIMEYQDILHSKIDKLNEDRALVRANTNWIIQGAELQESRLDTEPHSGWESFWLDSIQDVKSASAPVDSTFFTQVPLMAFLNHQGVIDTFCLPVGTHFEFFLNLETISTNGNDVFAIGLSTSERILDSIVVDRKHGGRRDNDFGFHLFYRGTVTPGMTQLNIVYNAEARRFQNPISKDDAFFWGYKILSDLDTSVATDRAAPCCELGCDFNFAETNGVEKKSKMNAKTGWWE